MSRSTLSIPPIIIEPASTKNTAQTRKPIKRVSISNLVINITASPPCDETSQASCFAHDKSEKESILSERRKSELSNSTQSSRRSSCSDVIDKPVGPHVFPLGRKNSLPSGDLSGSSKKFQVHNAIGVSTLIFNKNNPYYDEDTSSEPSSSSYSRHPEKVLKRGSSFDAIPLSSPDSPLAKHVKNFLIIPVESKNSHKRTSAD